LSEDTADYKWNKAKVHLTCIFSMQDKSTQTLSPAPPAALTRKLDAYQLSTPQIKATAFIR
jgi:hypothetical protein